MTPLEMNLDLVLHRPANVPHARWTEVLTAACCQRRVPHLRSFSIGTEQTCLSISVPDVDPASHLALDFEAVAAVIAALAPAPAPRPTQP